jgi:hypothetical protein
MNDANRELGAALGVAVLGNTIAAFHVVEERRDRPVRTHLGGYESLG